MSHDTFNFWIVLAMVLPVTAIPVLYGWRQAWHRSAYGRAFMVLAVGQALLINFAVTFRLFPDFPAKPYIATTVYVLLLVAFTWLAVLMARLPRGR